MDLFSLAAGGLTTAGIGAAAALASGLVGSGHCALMCGPLACASGGSGADAFEPRQRRARALGWQLGRLGAYAGVGAVLGGVGHAAAAALAGPATRALPWIMAGGLVVSALRVGRTVRPLPVLAKIPRRAARASATFSPFRRALLRGMATPFLPCGLLYGAFLMAAAAGSVVGGALVMTAFGVGAAPVLALVQLAVPSGAARLAGAHPRAAGIARRAIPLAAALVLVWRALAAGGGATSVPHCH